MVEQGEVRSLVYKVRYVVFEMIKYVLYVYSREENGVVLNVGDQSIKQMNRSFLRTFGIRLQL